MKRLIISIAAILLFAGSTVAQQTTGGISGTVTYGPDKAVVHNVAIRIKELERVTATDDLGTYRFTALTAGTYHLTTHIEGFKDVTSTAVVRNGETVTVDFDIQLAGVAADVSVNGDDTTPQIAFSNVKALDSVQIAARPTAGLGDVLAGEAGVAKRSAGPGASRPVIRGFDGDRVKVTTDGVGVGSLGAQSGDHAEPVDTLSVERIEVIKGPETLLYSSGAIGGVVNAVSGREEEWHPGLRGYFSTSGGAPGASGSVAGGIQYGYRKWLVWANANGQRSDAYSAGGDWGKVLNTFTRSAGGTIGVGYYGEKGFINGSFSYVQNRYGIPLDIREDSPEERSLRMHRNDTRFSFGYNDGELPFSKIRFTVDLSRYRHQEIADREVGTTFRNDTNSVRGIFEQKRFRNLNGKFGFEFSGRDFSTVGDEMLINGPVKEGSFAGFAFEELKFGRLGLEFAGRLEHRRYDPRNEFLPDRKFSGFSGAASAKFDAWKGGRLVASYKHSYRPPALDELYNHGPHDGTLAYEIGSNALRPEIGDGIDLSFAQTANRFQGQAAFYYYRLQDYIFLAPTGDIDPDSGFPIARYLQGTSRFWGFELQGQAKLSKFADLLAGADYVQAELSDGRALPRIPPLRGRISLDIHYNSFSLKPEFVAVAKQTRTFTGETSTAGYGVVNLSASYVVVQKHLAHLFSLSAFNLNNKLYFNHVSFIKDISPEMGRGVKFTYTVRYF
ncbi:MAG TPA: TonB-dependent receptor [Pyrinomonadaceae bacterium]|nr:TonB-dependent receptor [Pyrinomonadaceae bacterium]